uniref:Uncharacterized protein n=1 Tax=Alexandrium monilatum TaxID=311494 RepID=A0A7S4Q9Y6_9DINO
MSMPRGLQASADFGACCEWEVVEDEVEPAASERRRCQDDGRVYTLDAFIARYSGEYCTRELQAYWRDCCRPLTAEQAELAQDLQQAAVRQHHFFTALPQRLACGNGNFYLVSLGGWCGPKLAFRQLEGMDGPSLPWDWGRSTLDNVTHTLQTDFDDFLKADRRLESRWAAQGMCHPHGVICTTKGHAFWHHDLFHPRDRQVLGRRIQRFRGLGQFSPLLFVRAVVTTLELCSAEVLLDLLRQRFGDAVWLLLLVDWQVEDRALLFEETPALLVHTVREGSTPAGQHNSVAYRTPIAAALRYACSGEHPGPFLRLCAVSELLERPDGLLRHASFGENLTDPMAYEPVMPPPRAIEDAQGGLQRRILREQYENALAVEAKTT